MDHHLCAQIGWLKYIHTVSDRSLGKKNSSFFTPCIGSTGKETRNIYMHIDTHMYKHMYRRTRFFYTHRIPSVHHNAFWARRGTLNIELGKHLLSRFRGCSVQEGISRSLECGMQDDIFRDPCEELPRLQTHYSASWFAFPSTSTRTSQAPA